jgi:hypothetical protein
MHNVVKTGPLAKKPIQGNSSGMPSDVHLLPATIETLF